MSMMAGISKYTEPTTAMLVNASSRLKAAIIRIKASARRTELKKRHSHFKDSNSVISDDWLDSCSVMVSFLYLADARGRY